MVRRRRRRRQPAAAQPPELAQQQPGTDPLILFDPRRPCAACAAPETSTKHCPTCFGSGRERTSLRDLWCPSPAFLVCGGPSLLTVDYGRLAERGIASLAVNNAAAIAPVRAMVYADPPEKFHHGVFFDPAIMKFAPHKHLENRVRAKLADGSFKLTAYRPCDCPSVWGYYRSATWDPDTFLMSESALWGNRKAAANMNGRPQILFTFFVGLRLLHYLGCPRVYLLGADFRMEPGFGYAWAPAESDKLIAGNNDHYRIASVMLAELKPRLDAAGFGVFNVNPESRLTVFPYVPFGEALADCRGAVPAGELDPAGYYTKDRDRKNGTDAGFG